MRKISSILLAIVFASTFVIGQNQNSEKEIDNSEYVIADKADSQSGSLDNTDPVYNRAFSDGYDASCNKSASLSSSGSSVYYDVYEIHTTVSEALDISITSNGLGDSHMTLYCSFDPMDPLANIMCIDDDGGLGLLSAFTPGDNYIIDANTTYYLVVTSFGSGETGGYTVDMGGNLVFGAYATPTVPISNWAFAIIGILALTFVFIKFRK